MAIYLAVSVTVNHFRLKYRIKNISIDDYEITTEVVVNTSSESYSLKSPKWHSKKVYNHTLHFESGKIWRVPEDNYLWSEERRMSDFAIYQSSHCGDVFIVVSEKDTGNIVIAYNTDFFELKK